MKKETKKITGLVLVIIVVISLFSACGSGAPANDSTAGTTAKSTTASSATTEAASEEIPEFWLFSNFGRMASEGAVGSDPANLEMVTKYLTENSGVKINVIVPPIGSEAERLSLRLASNDPIDIFSGDWRKYKLSGMALELTDYVPRLGSYAEHWSSIDKNWLTVVSDEEGKVWGLPNTTALVAYPVFVRQDWLDKLNLPVPTTFDELETVLEAFKANDMSGTGETIPLLTTTVKDLFQCFAGGWLPMNEAGNWIADDGSVMPVEMHPAYEQFVAKMAEWYQKGYIYKESFQINRSRTAELISQNKVGVTALWYSYTTVPLPDLRLNVPEAEYTVLELYGEQGYAQVVNGPRYGDSVVITSRTTAIDAILQYINWVNSDVENYIIARNGIKDVNWRYLDGKDGSDGNMRLLEWIDQSGYVGEYEGLGNMYISLNYAFAVDGKLHPTGVYFPSLLDFSKVKYQGDYTTYYDLDRIDEAFPHQGDIERIKTEEVVKFISGARPMSDWPAFQEELRYAGMEQWIAAYTEQYKEQH